MRLLCLMIILVLTLEYWTKFFTTCRDGFSWIAGYPTRWSEKVPWWCYCYGDIAGRKDLEIVRKIPLNIKMNSLVCIKICQNLWSSIHVRRGWGSARTHLSRAHAIFVQLLGKLQAGAGGLDINQGSSNGKKKKKKKDRILTRIEIFVVETLESAS